MCGIVGFIENRTYQNSDKNIGRKCNSNKNNNPKSYFQEEVLSAMMEKIAHRGPDGSGMYFDDIIALGHRRLSIIDLEGGKQPMKNEDGTLICIFNGEIYNFPSLKKQLEEKGHSFATNSDTEVLLHGYEEWNSELPKKLRGMFAFAIWDKQKKELFCARDYFGIKPFYYYKKEDVFLFGSEIKSFLEHPHFEKRLYEKQLEVYLTYQYSPSDTTFFENVYKLLPAHWLLWKDGTLKIQRYWQADFIADDTREKEEWVTKIDEILQDSVNVHKISDVEVGSFLSSGVDSSYITYLAEVEETFTVGFKENVTNKNAKGMFCENILNTDKSNFLMDVKRKNLPSNNYLKKQVSEKQRYQKQRSYRTEVSKKFTKEPIRDFTGCNKYEESKLAQKFSQSIGVKNTIYQISADEFFQELPKIQYYMDEPLADAASVALYFLNREASKKVKVCLSGEGADELFGGYNIYKEPFMCKKYERLPFILRKGIGKMASLFPSVKGINFLVRHSIPLRERYIGTTTLFTEKEKKKLMKRFSGELCAVDVVKQYFKSFKYGSDNEIVHSYPKIVKINTKKLDYKKKQKNNFKCQICQETLKTEEIKNKDDKKYIGLNSKTNDKWNIADDVTYMQMVDLHLWLAGDILLKADKMSMANSLELRVPFLDKEVFEVARQIPTNYRVNAKETKIALRSSASKKIGMENANREKLGFPIPIKEWLREEPYVSYVREVFQSPSAEKFFDTKLLNRLLQLHVSEKQDCWRKIWCVYVFLVWYGVYFGEE